MSIIQPKVHIVLDNIRSAFNVGSIFRTADALGCAHIYLCGITSPADNPKLTKTALGATQSVPSTQYDNTPKCIDDLKSRNIPIYAVELTDNAKHFQHVEYPAELAIVLGNEIDGVDQRILDIAHEHIYIPMLGMKESLNVANTAAIIMFESVRGRI